MALYVNTNVSALNGQKNLTNVTNRMNSSFEKLSSGSRINSAKDDAAGLQISDRLTTQIIGLEQGTRNANDGISIAQIAEGALSEVTNNVQRMRQLVVQGGNRTLSHEDREALGDEFSKLLDVNDDISERTAFGTMKILNYNSPKSGFQIQSGAQSGEQDTVTTGNAKLTSMFGELLIRENANGVLSKFFDSDGNGVAFTGTSATSVTVTSSALIDAGTLGELVAAHMVRTGESIAGNALLDLFGLPAGDGSLLFDVNVSTIATQSELQIDPQVITNLLIGNAGNGATPASTNFNVIQGLSAVANNFFDFRASQMDNILRYTAIGAAPNPAGSLQFATYSDDNLSGLNAFATDTLLDMMSGLVTEVDRMRAKMGAEQNGLASTIRSNTTAVVNVSDSRSRITDTDFAKETAELTRNQIIQQASTSILSQANQLPQAALTLLG